MVAAGVGWFVILLPLVSFLPEGHKALSLKWLLVIGGICAASVVAVPYALLGYLGQLDPDAGKQILVVASLGILMGSAYPLLVNLRKSCQPCSV